MTSIDRLVAELRRLGVRRGDHLMVHASLRAIGPVAGGPEAVIAALDAAVGRRGTLMMVLGADAVPEWLHEAPPAEGEPSADLSRAFDARSTPAHPEIGWLAEVFRVSPGTSVTDHPLGRFGARGRLTGFLLRDAPWHDYYGAGSPLERLCEAGGRVLRLGADPNTVTLFHWAEYLARIEDRRRLRRYVGVAGPGGARIRHVDALDDAEGIVAWEDDDYFSLALADYLRTGRGGRGRVGNARSELLDAADLAHFAARWMEVHLPRGRTDRPAQYPSS